MAATMAQEIQAAGGIMTADDLQRAKPSSVVPETLDIGEYRLTVPPPPSSAGAVAMAVKMLSMYPNLKDGPEDLLQHRYATHSSAAQQWSPAQLFVPSPCLHAHSPAHQLSKSCCVSA